MAKSKIQDDSTTSNEVVEFSQSTDIVSIKVIADFDTLKAGDELEVSQNIAEILVFKKLATIK